MIRPYLNGFTIAFNVSQPNTWQPYVDNMHHFLAGELFVTLGVMVELFLSMAMCIRCPSWASHEPHLEREAHKVMGASVGGRFAFPGMTS